MVRSCQQEVEALEGGTKREEVLSRKDWVR